MMPDIDSYEVCRTTFDLSMPCLSGRQVIDRLRAIDPEVKIIVFTEHATAAKEFADVTFLSKPLRNQIIIRTVQDMLN
jgi:CheY-like chemotaxis protein